MHRRVSKGTKDLLRFKMTMLEEVFFVEICSICTLGLGLGSIYTPRDCINSTCFIEFLSIAKDGSLKKSI